MRLGFASMNTTADPRADVLAKALEERGYDSLWIGEHSHIPVSRLTPYPAGGDMPENYKHMLDPFVSLTLAAAATTTLTIGTGVTLPLEHDLLVLAKSVATLDLVSGGRVRFGVGVGWNAEELANHSPVAWGKRYSALEEAVAALRALWTMDEAEFHGSLYSFDPVWSYPKPVQKPHPPVVCGMAGKVGTAHTVRWGDEWMPMDLALGYVPKKVARFREACEAAGRDPLPITLVTMGDPPIETLELYRELGIERVVLGPERTRWDDPSGVLPFLDVYAQHIDRLR